MPRRFHVVAAVAVIAASSATSCSNPIVFCAVARWEPRAYAIRRIVVHRARSRNYPMATAAHRRRATVAGASRRAMVHHAFGARNCRGADASDGTCAHGPFAPAGRPVCRCAMVHGMRRHRWMASALCATAAAADGLLRCGHRQCRMCTPSTDGPCRLWRADAGSPARPTATSVVAGVRCCRRRRGVAWEARRPVEKATAVVGDSPARRTARESWRRLSGNPSPGP